MARKPTPKDAPIKPSAGLFQNVALEQVIVSLSRLADPDLVLQKQNLGRHELRKLETDDEISAALETRREAVIATPWHLQPFEGEAAEWLWGQLDAHMEPILRGAWSAVPYGYSVMEAVYEQQDARIAWAYIQEKPMEWFEPTREGTLKYTPPGAQESIEVDTMAKFFLTRRNPSYRNPYGEALLSRVYWPWFFRANGWQFWMRFLERFADPLLLGKVFDPAGFVAAMNKMGLEAVVGVATTEDVSAISPALAGEFERVDIALSKRIQKLVLGQTLTTDVGDTGSYAAASVHNTVREDKRRADIRLVTGTVQRMIDALWQLNNFPLPAPTFALQDDMMVDATRADRDAKLVQAGVLQLTEKYLLDNYDYEAGDFVVSSGDIAGEERVSARDINAFGLGMQSLTEAGLAIPESWVRSRTGIPAPQGSEPTLAVPESSAPTVQAQFAAAPGVRGGQRFSADQQWVEDLIHASAAKAKSPVPTDALRRAILSADGPDALAESLSQLYRESDPEAFRELLERALFAADVLGYVTAEKRVGAPGA
jgi:phage gp29-like protein